MLWKRRRNLLIEEAGSCEQSTRDREICMCMTSWCIPGTCRICQIGVVFGSLDTLLTTDKENSTIFLPPDIFHHGKHYNLFYFLDDCFSLMYSITLLIHLFSINIIHNLIHFYDYTYLVYKWFYNRRWIVLKVNFWILKNTCWIGNLYLHINYISYGISPVDFSCKYNYCFICNFCIWWRTYAVCN